MWGSRTKPSKAIKKWHNKAMLVDPRKTKITILWAETPETFESQENLKNMTLNPETEESAVVGEAFIQDAKESLEAVDPKFEIAEDFFDATEPEPKTEESNTIEKEEFDEANNNLENVEPILEPLESNTSNEQEATCFAEIGRTITNVEADAEQTIETLRPETAETLNTNDGIATLVTLDPILQNAEWNRVEAKADSETIAGLETVKQNPKSMPPARSKAPKSPATIEYLKGQESIAMGDADGYEPEDCARELIAIEKESLNIRFLRVLEKTRSNWYNDRQFAKIVQKMKQGKNLKRKEFDRVYMHIRTYCGYN
jgi:hypothetical protein